jgi:hypothetical protein
MVMTATAPRTLSLRAARLLPRARREERQHDLVSFQIEDLNGIYDGLRLRRYSAETQLRAEEAQRRIRRTIAAAACCPERFEAGAWRYLETEVERPEDAFGAAAILFGLSITGDGRRQLAAELPSSAGAMLVRLGVELPATLPSFKKTKSGRYLPPTSQRP